MATAVALEHCFAGSNRCLTGRRDDTWHANQFSHHVTLEVSQHAWHLICVDLHLEFGINIHLKVVVIIIVVPVDDLHGRLEDFEVVCGIVS